MTSIIGIRARHNSGNYYVLMGADTQQTNYIKNKPVTKSLTNKIWAGEWGAIAITGSADESDEFEEFKEIFSDRDRKSSKKESALEVINKAITPNEKGERIFQEVNDLNRRLSKKGLCVDDLNEFILATSNPSVDLYYVDSLGNVFNYKEFCDVYRIEKSKLEYLTLGTGEDILIKYINRRINDKSNPIDSKNTPVINISLTIREALRYASKDLQTGGIDLVSITKNGGYPWGAKIRSKLEELEVDEFETIGEQIDEELDKLRDLKQQP